MKLQFAICLLLFISAPTYAETCENLISEINADIIKYDSELSTKKLPWMELDVLQKKLGKAKVTQPKPDTTNYHWECRENSRNMLTITTDKAAKIIHIEGRYSSAKGAKYFSTCLISSCNNYSSAIPEEKKEVKTDGNDACNKIAREIYNTSVYYENIKETSYSPTKPSIQYPRYSWEKRDWLEKYLGAGTSYRSKLDVGLTWQCPAKTNDADSKNEIYFLPTQGGYTIISSKFCDIKNCYFSSVIRSFSKLKTHVSTYPR